MARVVHHGSASDALRRISKSPSARVGASIVETPIPIKGTPKPVGGIHRQFPKNVITVCSKVAISRKNATIDAIRVLPLYVKYIQQAMAAINEKYKQINTNNAVVNQGPLIPLSTVGM